MLNRTMTPGEEVVITLPDGREVKIVALTKQKRGKNLTIGIDAPKDVKISPAPRKHINANQPADNQVQSMAGT